MDLITLGAALKGAKTQTESYVDSHFKAGSNITITDNVDGTQTIAASGEVSSEDTVARGEIADHVANTSNPHDVKGDQVELHTYAKATEKVAIASGDKVNEALGKLEKKIDDNVINDSTITIKKNGTIVDSFTTNASSGKEINIAVPSTAADVGALADTVKYAGSASAGGSATSAVKLDNAADSGSLTQPIFFDNGKPKATSYSLAKSVPSDAVFTDTTYESKAAVQSGSDVSLVTTGEKYTWNNKQNAISTSSRLAGNAVNMTGYAKASEQAAISSGDVMTTAIGKLEKKADDNKNNILSVKDHYKYGNRILFEQESIPTGTIAYGSTWIDGKAVRTYNQTTNIIGGVIEQGSWNAANIVKIDSTTRCRLSNSITVKPSTTYTIRLVSPTINNARVLLQYRDSNDYTSSESGWQTTLPYTFTTPSNCYKATIILSTVGDLICTPTDFGNLQINEGNTALSYEVPSWSTTDSEIITPALQECVNNGVKNLWDFANATGINAVSVTYNKTSTSITVTSTQGWAACGYPITLPAGTYIWSMTISNYNVAVNSAKIRVATQNTTQGSIGQSDITGNGKAQVEFTTTGGTIYLFYYPNFSDQNVANTFTASDNMVCLKSLYDADTSYKPYALSNAELTEAKQDKSAINSGTTNLNDLTEGGTYFTGNVGSSQNAPTSGYFFVNVVYGASDSILQEAVRLNNPDKIYRRQYITNAWSSWYLFTGTVVS